MNAKITLAVLLLSVGLVPSVAGQVVETNAPDSTSDLYQNDGDSGEDASDDCRRSKLLLSSGQAHEGQIVPGEDNADTWRLDVDPGTTTVSVLTSQALPDTPLAREIVDFRIDLQVFVFDDPLDPLENPPILACREPAHHATTRSDGEAFVEFDVDAGLTYFVQVEFAGAYVGPSTPAAVPLSGHCSPWCFQSYDLAV